MMKNKPIMTIIHCNVKTRQIVMEDNKTKEIKVFTIYKI